MAKDLLDVLKQERLVLDWRQRQQFRAAVRVTVEKILDELPETYNLNLYCQKCDAVYQHVYDSCYGPGDNNIYAKAS